MDDTAAIIELLSNKVKHGMDILSASDKYLETMDEALVDKVSVVISKTIPLLIFMNKYKSFAFRKEFTIFPNQFFFQIYHSF